MRENKLRLSQLIPIPNAWFYKFRDRAKNRENSKNSTTSRSRKKKQQPFSCFPSPKTPCTPKPVPCSSRKSHYFARDFTQKPAHSSPTKTQFLDPPENLHAGDTGLSPEPVISVVETITEEITPDRVLTDGRVGVFCPSRGSCNMNDKQNGVVLEDPKPKLRPIVTKPTKPNNKAKPSSSQDPNGSVSRNIKKRSPNHSPDGVRLRKSPPRVPGRRSFHGGRKSSCSRRSLSDSLAVMKTTVDPEREFRESMMEMIVENKIHSSNDFEELLACYLCLNSDQHHYVIIKVFKQIWLDLAPPLIKVDTRILKQR